MVPSLIFNALFLFEFFSLAYSAFWLSDLYFSNQTYIRDIFLIISLIFCVLLDGMCCLGIWKTIPILTIMIIQLNSMFLLMRVNSSKDKWKSNIYKILSFFFSLYAIVSENWLVYLASFTLILTIDTLFSIKMEIPRKHRFINYLIYILGFLSIYCYFQNKIGIFDVNSIKIMVLILNFLIVGKAFIRIKQITDYKI